MAEIDFSLLREKITQVFSNEGALHEAIVRYQPREAQVTLALSVLEAIAHRKRLVAEVGTGVGKTFAYLIPVLLSGKKTIVSTATKTLQDQLVQKDLPFLQRVLGLSCRVQNLKGRSNYLCYERVNAYRDAGTFASVECVKDFAYVQESIPRLLEGVRSELPEISEDSLIWPHVTSTRDNCLGNTCDFYHRCFLVKARKKAQESDVTVINHHLFFADLYLKEEGLGEILPGVSVVIFDEAHHLGEIAELAQEKQVGTRECVDCLEGALSYLSPQVTLPFLDAIDAIHRATFLLQEALLVFPERVLWHDVQKKSSILSAFLAFLKTLQEASQLFSDLLPDGEMQPALETFRKRFQTFTQIIEEFANTEDSIRWISRFKQSLKFHLTPFEVGEIFSKKLSQETTYIFTSATLAQAGNFDGFIKKLSLETAETLLLKSPFHYEKQALLYLPRGMPDPKHLQYAQMLVDKLLPILEACGGRTFFLFTSYTMLRDVAVALKTVLKYPILVQGEESSSILLLRFRELGNAVLLGTATFWEGVDVKGDALFCVVIDKLPFASPADPIMRGKIAWYRKNGRSDFHELTLPDAILALRQGVGRLIRDAHDSGLLVICDPRLWTRPYGALILKSLPPFPKTRMLARVLAFIEDEKIHEVTSH